MLKRILIRKNDRAALLKDGDYERILNPGRHWFVGPARRLSTVVWEIGGPAGGVGLDG